MSNAWQADFWRQTALAASGDDPCLLWQGRRFAKCGYGRYGARRVTPELYAHRIAWTLTYGPIPPGVCVLHRCDVRLCVKPEHLFLGTQADNVADMDRKGRRALTAGDANGNWKPIPSTKVCGQCSADKPVDQFYKAAGRHPERTCIACRRQRAQERYLQRTEVVAV